MIQWITFEVEKILIRNKVASNVEHDRMSASRASKIYSKDLGDGSIIATHSRRHDGDRSLTIVAQRSLHSGKNTRIILAGHRVFGHTQQRHLGKHELSNP